MKRVNGYLVRAYVNSNYYKLVDMLYSLNSLSQILLNEQTIHSSCFLSNLYAGLPHNFVNRVTEKYVFPFPQSFENVAKN